MSPNWVCNVEGIEHHQCYHALLKNIETIHFNYLVVEDSAYQAGSPENNHEYYGSEYHDIAIV